MPTPIKTDQKALFGVPHNGEMFSYWDKIEDRLFKIRNSLNLEGVSRQVPLFAAPIDPRLILRMKAAGLSLSDMQAFLSEVPYYRFTFLLEKARQVAQNVQSLGGALLSAQEKKDGEELSLLRSVHEQNLQNLTRNIKLQQIKDAQYSLDSLKATRVNVENRINYYTGLIQKGLNTWELAQQRTKNKATNLRIAETVLSTSASLVRLLPQITVGFAAGVTTGGDQLGGQLSEMSRVPGALSSMFSEISSSQSMEATFQRRREEWEHQLKLARQELKPLEKQILGAELKIYLAERDLALHEQTIQQSKEQFDFLKNKFSNYGLYTYLLNSLSKLYYDSYDMAYTMAKEAEAALRYERGTADGIGIFIQGNNWNGVRNGLMAGERLLFQLTQMEHAYLKTNERLLEITQTFSIQQMDPKAILDLQNTGETRLRIPEMAFDLHYPGHFNRRIKAVKITLPCIAGPQATIGAELSLTGSWTRTEDNLVSVSGSPTGVYSQGSVSFKQDENRGLTSTIATSGAQNDSGLFELNFKDERFLPFEGRGAISDWNLKLPGKVRTFDYRTISDVMLSISYTAERSSNVLFREAVENHVADKLENFFEGLTEASQLTRIISLKQEMPDLFSAILPRKIDDSSYDFLIVNQFLPDYIAKKNPKIQSVEIFVVPKTDRFPDSVALESEFVVNIFKGLNSDNPPVSEYFDYTMYSWENYPPDSEFYQLKRSILSVSPTPNPLPPLIGKHKISTKGFSKPDLIDDILISFSYSI